MRQTLSSVEAEKPMKHLCLDAALEVTVTCQTPRGQSSAASWSSRPRPRRCICDGDVADSANRTVSDDVVLEVDSCSSCSTWIDLAFWAFQKAEKLTFHVGMDSDGLAVGWQSGRRRSAALVYLIVIHLWTILADF